jgi:AbrB family looped-hinge helix DNA binding protein
MRLTSKGQVTIPQDIREQTGLLPHVEVEFEVTADGVLIRKKRGQAGRGQRLLEAMRRAPRPGMTTDELMALTRGED